MAVLCLEGLPKEFLCGHRNSLGTVQLLGDTQHLCVSWWLVLGRLLYRSARVKLAGIKL